LSETVWYYRGGRDLTPRPHDVRIDRQTGLLKIGYGISVFSNPERVAKFGGAFRLDQIPEGLIVIQRGKDPEHFEVVPSSPMSLEDYSTLLSHIILSIV
jgi:hypothetical protein